MGHTYRATGLAMVIGIGDLGAIIGTQLYRIPLGSLANARYKYSHILAIVWLLIGVVAASLLYIGLSRENARFEREEKEGVRKSVEKTQNGKPWQRSFRYQL